MIIQNALKITEGDKVTYIKSAHRHDFVSYEFAGGGMTFTDGGNSYIRRGGTEIKRENVAVDDFSLEDISNIDDIRGKLLWGSRGVNGDEELTYSPIKNLTIDHLRAILDNVENIAPLHKNVIEHWILDKQNEKA